MWVSSRPRKASPALALRAARGGGGREGAARLDVRLRPRELAGPRRRPGHLPPVAGGGLVPGRAGQPEAAGRRRGHLRAGLGRPEGFPRQQLLRGRSGTRSPSPESLSFCALAGGEGSWLPGSESTGVGPGGLLAFGAFGRRSFWLAEPGLASSTAAFPSWREEMRGEERKGKARASARHCRKRRLAARL